MEHIRYKKETEVVTFSGKEITLENLSRCSRRAGKAAKRRELEQQLFMRCSASMPTNGRVRKPGHKIFESHR